MDIYNIAAVYIILYKMSMFLFVIFLYSCISYIDRAHAREKTRIIGCFIHKQLTECKYDIVCSTYDKSRYIILRPLCVLSECITGFIEGIENCDPIYKIQYTQINDEIIEEDTNIEHKAIKYNMPIEQDANDHKLTKQELTKQDANEQDANEQNITKQDANEQDANEQNITKQDATKQDAIKHNIFIEQDVKEQNTPSKYEHLDTETPHIIDSGKKQASITLVRRRYNNT